MGWTSCAHGPRDEPGQRGGPSEQQSALPAHDMPEREEGNPSSQEEEEDEGATPEQRALPAHGMQRRGRPPNPKTASRQPPKQRAPSAHGMKG